MRSKFYLAVAMIAALLNFGSTSCQKEDDDSINKPDTENSSGTTTFTVMGEQGKSINKTQYTYKDSQIDKIVWQATDDFSLVPMGDGQRNLRYTVSSINSSNPSICEITGGNYYYPSGYFAVYPHQIGIYSSNNGITNAELPAEQIVEEGQYDPKADVLAGFIPSPDKSFIMRHIGSKIAITIPDEGVKSVIIESTKKLTNLAGKTQIANVGNPDDIPVVTSVLLGTGSTKITLTCPSGFQKGKTYYACVLPTQKETTLVIRMYTDDDKTVGKYYRADIPAIERNQRITAAPPADKGHSFGGKAYLSAADIADAGIPGYDKIIFDNLEENYSPSLTLIKTTNDGQISIYKDSDNKAYVLSDHLICASGDLTGMFSDFSASEIIFNNFSTEGATSMENMFNNCQNLRELDLTKFDTKEVTSMAYMFNNCPNMSKLDLTKFDTQKVESMVRMFYGCSSLKELDLVNFITTKNTSMTRMFMECSGLERIYASTKFQVPSILSAKGSFMFSSCTSLKGGRGTTVTAGNTSSEYAYIDSPSKKGYFTLKSHEKVYVTLEELNKWENFPNSATKINFDYRAVIDVSKMTHLSTLKDGDIECYRNGSSEYYILSDKEICLQGSLERLFSTYKSLTAVNFYNFNTEDVTSMYCMFAECVSLESLDLSTFNTEKVVHMTYMFQLCYKLKSINLKSFNTSRVKTMSWMFARCGVVTLDLSNFNTSNVTDMNYMFRGCEMVTLYATFDTRKVEEMDEIFFDCPNLKTIYSRENWTVGAKVEIKNPVLFSNCPNLVGGNGSKYNDYNHSNNLYWLVIDTPKRSGYFTQMP